MLGSTEGGEREREEEREREGGMERWMKRVRERRGNGALRSKE